MNVVRLFWKKAFQIQLRSFTKNDSAPKMTARERLTVHTSAMLKVKDRGTLARALAQFRTANCWYKSLTIGFNGAKLLVEICPCNGSTKLKLLSADYIYFLIVSNGYALFKHTSEHFMIFKISARIILGMINTNLSVLNAASLIAMLFTIKRMGMKEH